MSKSLSSQHVIFDNIQVINEVFHISLFIISLQNWMCNLHLQHISHQTSPVSST